MDLQGLADARNAGLQYVNGDWIVVLDSDDLFESTYFEHILKLKVLQGA